MQKKIDLLAKFKLEEIPESEDQKILQEISTQNSPFDNECVDVLFPGSFNPIHLGHLECIKLCPEKVLIMPDRNPLKDLDKRRILKIYLEVFEAVKDLNCSVYPGLLLKKSANPTSSWIGNIKSKKKKLLVGDDSFMSIHNWVKAETLLANLNTIYVVPRFHNAQSYKAQEDKLKRINSELEFIFLPAHKHQDKSSTKLRKYLF